MAYDLGGDFIWSVAPKFTGAKAVAQKAIVAAIAPIFGKVLGEYQINTKLRIAHFMGQVTHECAGFSTTEEFASGQAYEGRKDLGNVKKGDGKRYKGRGLIQLTGRDNYRRIGKRLGLDLEGKPELAADSAVSLRIACEYWQSRNINALADKDDLEAVTKAVNGGLNGLADRRRYLNKAKAALDAQDRVKATPTAEMAMKLGDTGPLVEELQRNLTTLDYPLTITGTFDKPTDDAVRAFQRLNKDEASQPLKVDGIVGLRTSKAIAAALLKPKMKEAEKTVPVTADKAVKEKTSLWGKIVAVFGGGGLGLGWVTGMDWKAVVAAGGVLVVLLIIGLILQNQILAAFDKINERARA